MQIDKLHLIKGEKSNLAFYYPTQVSHPFKKRI